MGAQTVTVGGIDANNAEALSEEYADHVSYSATTNTLTLKDATISGSEIGGGCILSSLSSLTIVIIGQNTITTTDSCTSIRSTYNGAQSLTIRKGSYDANLSLGSRPIRDFNSLTIDGLVWDEEYTYGIANVGYGNGYALTIETPEAGMREVQNPALRSSIWVMVTENQLEETRGSGDGLGVDIEDKQSQTTVVSNNILYSLGTNDGYLQEDSYKLVLLNTQQASIPNAEPGTSDFHNNFKGLVFLIPAGKGKITVNAKTEGEGVLNVQIEGRNLKTFSGLSTFTDCEIPYATTTDAYVYIYNSAEEVEPSASRRAPGRKMANTTSLKSVKVAASSVASAGPSTPASPSVTLTKEMVNAALNDQHVVISDGDVYEIASDAFDGLSNITYIDLSATAITGLTNRTGFPENTIVLLPTGNDITTGTKNVVIAGICEDLLLSDAQRFDIPSDFTAVKVAQARTYTEGKNSTICLPYALDATQAAALGKFYELTSLSEGKATMTSVDATTANTPYMFKPTATEVSAEMVEIKKPVAAQVSGTETRFVGTYQAKSIITSGSTQYYCFSEEGTFLHVTSAVNVKPFRAYITFDGSALGRSLDIDFGDGTTGISNVPSQKFNVQNYYDLQGRRVLYPKKGVYILNGKKVIIK